MPSTWPRRAQSGFTLIELVSVIIILGVMSAVAMPRFMSMTAEARIAKMKAMAGTLSSAVTMASAKWLVAGKPGYIFINPSTAITFVNGSPTPVTLMRLLHNEAVQDVAVFSINPFDAGGSAVMCDMKAASFTAGATSTWGCNDNPNKCAIKYTASPDGGVMTFTMDTSRLTTANCQ